MLYGAVVRAPVEGAAPLHFDEAKVSSVAGVIKTVTLPYGVGVVANSPWAAFGARDVIAATVTWTSSAKGWGFDSDAGLEAFAKIARDPAQPATEWFKAGDVPGALSNAVTTLDGLYLCDCAYHAQMEPLNAVASVAQTGDSAEVWTGTQSPTTASEATAKALRNFTRPREDQLHADGRRIWPAGPRDSDFTVDAVLLSKAVARPVKVMWTREDDIHNGPLPATFSALSACRF